MSAYILRRLLLIVPTIFGILLINFLIVQAAPGGPVEQVIAQLEGFDSSVTGRIGGSGDGGIVQEMVEMEGQPGSHGLSPELIALIEKQYGFDTKLP